MVDQYELGNHWMANLLEYLTGKPVEVKKFLEIDSPAGLNSISSGMVKKLYLRGEWSEISEHTNDHNARSLAEVYTKNLIQDVAHLNFENRSKGIETVKLGKK